MRISQIINEASEFFDVTTSGRITADEILFDNPEYYRKQKGQVGEIVNMSPNEYISRCNKGFTSIGYPDDNDAESTRDDKLVKKYAKMMKDGVKFHMPILDYRNDHFSQEGLHRAMAARSLGADSLPVVVLTSLPR